MLANNRLSFYRAQAIPPGSSGRRSRAVPLPGIQRAGSPLVGGAGGRIPSGFGRSRTRSSTQIKDLRESGRREHALRAKILLSKTLMQNKIGLVQRKKEFLK